MSEASVLSIGIADVSRSVVSFHRSRHKSTTRTITMESKGSPNIALRTYNHLHIFSSILVSNSA